MSDKKTISIIGGGPSSLLCASFLDPNLYDVTIYEKNNTVGRKFLVAGKGGFNLTHSEHIDIMKSRYTPNGFLDTSLDFFSNENLRSWLSEIGISTFVGSSKRVFPVKGIKPIEVLNAIVNHINEIGHKISVNNKWIGWKGDDLLFDGDLVVQSNITIVALGGGSWSVTGSDAAWISLFEQKGIKVDPLRPANCAYEIEWPKTIVDSLEGSPLKNIAIKSLDHSKKGEIVITKFGIEGGAVYALTDQIESQLGESGEAEIFIDLKPSLSKADMMEMFRNSEESTTDILKKKVKLERHKIKLIKGMLSKDEFTNIDTLVGLVKNFPLVIKGTATIDDAISTSGGICLDAVDENLQSKQIPNTYLMGEMLSWNAPTGGYLLQACFSMGAYLANQLNSKADKLTS